MSKFTINAAIALLRLALNLLPKITRLIYSVMDLVDDGCLNASVTRPAWMISLQGVIDTLTAVGSDLTSIESEVSNG